MDIDDLVRHCARCGHYHTAREGCEGFAREMDRVREEREKAVARILNEAFKTGEDL